MKKKYLNYTKIIVSLSLLSLLLKWIDLRGIINAVATVKYELLLLAFLFNFAGNFFQASRLKLLLKSQGNNISITKVFKINLMSTFFGIFLPTVIGGDILKIGFLKKRLGSKLTTTAIVAVDRLSGVYTLILIGFISSIVGFNSLNRSLIYNVFVLFAISLIFVFLLYNQTLWNNIWAFISRLPKNKWITKLKRLIDMIQLTKNASNQPILKAMCLSLLFYLFTIVSNFIIARALTLDVDLLAFFIYVPVLSLLSMIPISISGLGIRETISIFFFSTLSISPNHAVLLSIIPFVFKAILGFMGGLIYLKEPAYEIIFSKK